MKRDESLMVINCSVIGCPMKHPVLLNGFKSTQVKAEADKRFICYKHPGGMNTGALSKLLREITKELEVITCPTCGHKKTTAEAKHFKKLARWRKWRESNKDEERKRHRDWYKRNS